MSIQVDGLKKMLSLHSFLSEVMFGSGFVVNCVNSLNSWRGNRWMFAAGALVEVTLPCERCASSLGCLWQWWSACTRPLALCPGVCLHAPHPSVERCTNQELGQMFAWIAVEGSRLTHANKCATSSPRLLLCRWRRKRHPGCQRWCCKWAARCGRCLRPVRELWPLKCVWLPLRSRWCCVEGSGAPGRCRWCPGHGLQPPPEENKPMSRSFWSHSH